MFEKKEFKIPFHECRNHPQSKGGARCNPVEIKCKQAGKSSKQASKQNMDALCSDHDFAAALSPCDVFDAALEHEGGHAPPPAEWTPGLVPPGARSTFAEVSPAARIDSTLSPSDVEWVFRFSAQAIPKNTNGLARISVLLRGCEDTGIRTLVHSVVLAVSEVASGAEQSGEPRVIDVAAYPPRAHDARVLEFLLFSLERPLLFGASLANLSVHVHFTAPPPFSKDQIKIALDALYAPTLSPSTSAWMSLSRGGGPQQLDALSLLLDGATGKLRIEGTQSRSAREKWLDRIIPLKPEGSRSSPSTDDDYFDYAEADAEAYAEAEAILAFEGGLDEYSTSRAKFCKSTSKIHRGGHGWTTQKELPCGMPIGVTSAMPIGNPSESIVIPLEKTLHGLDLSGVDKLPVPLLKRPREGHAGDDPNGPLWQREFLKQMPGLPLHYSQRG